MSRFKTTSLLLLLMLGFSAKAQTTTIPFEVSDYGLIFTEVEVNGEKVKAMIDFGQPQLLMISSSLIEKQGLKTTKSDKVGYNIDGEEMAFYEGKVNELKVQGLGMENVDFSSSPNEMESVSAQIGTRFDAALGWAFFSKNPFTLNYSKQQIVLNSQLDTEAGVFEVAYDKTGNYMKLTVGLEEKTANMIMDTGAPISTLHEGFIDSAPTKTITYGVKEQLLNTRLGSTSFKVAYELRDLTVLEQLDVVGIIGGDVLKQYIISIDPDAQKMYWKPVG